MMTRQRSILSLSDGGAPCTRSCGNCCSRNVAAAAEPCHGRVDWQRRARASACLTLEAVQPRWIVAKNRAPDYGIGNRFDEDIEQLAGVELAVGQVGVVVHRMAGMKADVRPVGAPDEALRGDRGEGADERDGIAQPARAARDAVGAGELYPDVSRVQKPEHGLKTGLLRNPLTLPLNHQSELAIRAVPQLHEIEATLLERIQSALEFLPARRHPLEVQRLDEPVWICGAEVRPG